MQREKEKIWTERVRLWVEILGLPTAITLAVLTLCTLRTLNGQLQEAKRANNDLEKQFVEQQRPWVGSGEIVFKEPLFRIYPENPIQARTQLDILIEIPIKNAGVTPAFRVKVERAGTLSKEIAAPSNIDGLMEFACRNAEEETNNGGGALFPNSPETRLEMQTAITSPSIQVTEVHRIWVTICIAYSTLGSGAQLHHTKIWAASWPFDGQPKEIRRTTVPMRVFYSVPTSRWAVVKTEVD